MKKLFLFILIGVVSAHAQTINYNIESTDRLSQKDEAKRVVEFLVKLDAPERTIEEKLTTRYPVTVIATAIAELRAEGKVRNRSR